MNRHITDKCCVGCLGCKVICPKDAISDTVTSGFIKPKVNNGLCVDCGLCIKVCPKDSSIKNNSYSQRAYAVKHNNANILQKSTSGGAFSAFANYTISVGGVVYGCEIVAGKVQHMRTEYDFSGMCGSKYVQSALGKTFDNISKDLIMNKKVLFTGTPCQCAAIKNYLNIRKISTENLLLVDFICHGVTSPKLYADYIQYYEKRKKSKISNHIFRSKLRGWTKHTEVNYLTDGGIDWQSYESQLYKSIFHSHLGLNDACFECNFSSLNRVSDITMGDFWGVQKSHPELFDINGVSFVMINSNNGEKFFDSCSDIEKHSVSINDTEQPSLYHPAKKPKVYNQFWRDYEKKGFYYIVKKYYRGGRIYRTISDIYHILIRG